MSVQGYFLKTAWKRLSNEPLTARWVGTQMQEVTRQSERATHKVHCTVQVFFQSPQQLKLNPRNWDHCTRRMTYLSDEYMKRDFSCIR